jgi:hypothetical protein
LSFDIGFANGAMFAGDCLDITGPDNWSGAVSFETAEEINSGLARFKE